jgi:hypothetical protein
MSTAPRRQRSEISLQWLEQPECFAIAEFVKKMMILWSVEPWNGVDTILERELFIFLPVSLTVR